MPFHGLRLDLSAFGYTMAIAFLLSIIGFFVVSEKRNKLLNRLIHIYFWIITGLVSLIMAGEITTYIEWKTKLSSKIFLHFNTPSEIFRTGSGSYTFWFFLYVFLQLIFAYFVYFKVLKGNRLTVLDNVKLKVRALFSGAYLAVNAFLFVLFIRGGLQQIPVSTTTAYFSTKQIINDVTVNPVWNFINMTYTHFKVDLSEYYQNVAEDEQIRVTNQLFAETEKDTLQILNSSNPNIVLLTLEGWSAQLIEPLGGEKDITPNFNKICKEGLLFTEIYATGGTSETGHTSIISGYQTISGTSISTQSAKCRKLPSINQSLKKLGYNSFYTFGGALSYGNIGGYLTDVGLDKLVDENDLDLQPTGKLGIHDEAMFPYFLSEIKKAKAPYFYGLFTQSTHAPYDMPAEPMPNYEDDMYVTSMHYADKHLGLFLEELKQLPDYDNTLVILIADHGRANFVNPNTYDEDYFHIPLLFTGGALKEEFRNQTIDKIGSQADLAKTLLNQMNLPTGDYRWSKDLLNPSTKEWAICTSTLSYGWKNKEGYTVYDMINDNLVSSPYTNQFEIDSVLNLCRAVLESVYTEYEGL